MVTYRGQERGVRIETGVGWESRLQTETDQIVNSVLLPKLRDGDLGGAMVDGANAIAEAVRVELGAEGGSAESTPVVGETRRVISTRVVNVEIKEQPVIPDPNDRSSKSDTIPAWLQSIINWVLGIFSLGALGIGTYWLSQPPNCKHCQRPLRRLDEEKDNEFLNSGQNVEERLKSVDYVVWVCDYDDFVQISDRQSYFSRYEKCPTCDYKTVEKTTRTLKAATTNSTGLQEVTKDCKHCDYKHVYKMKLPKIVEHDDDDFGSSFGSSSSSRSFGGGSSGGGSFGGGHSSGGGSSGSW